MRSVLAKRFSRVDAHYEPAVRTAAMVLESTSLQDSFGEVTASSFLIDMNKVFEIFIETRLRAALVGYFDVHGQRTTHLDVDHRVRMVPDLTFLQDGRPVYVGDVKYKLGGGAIGGDADLYQLLAYVTALGVSEGVLVYAHSDDAPPPAKVRVIGTDKHLAMRRLDLRGSPGDIRASVDALAEWLLSRACQRSLR